MTKKIVKPKPKGRLSPNPVFGALTQLSQQVSRFRHFLAFKTWPLIMSVHPNGKDTCCSLKHMSVLGWMKEPGSVEIIQEAVASAPSTQFD